MSKPTRESVEARRPRVIVFGYHDIGTVCLQELLDQRANLVAVATHRDDPAEAIWFGSVAGLAAAHQIPVFVPDDPNAEAFVETIRNLRPELIFSFYYRRLLCPALLRIPALGAVNLHGSLLPKYRGRAPLNWVLVRGERMTGVTLHHMDERADHGDIIAQRPVPIAVEDTAFTLSRKLGSAARELLAEVYPQLIAGRAPRTPQDHAAATVFRRRTPADGLIDWSHPAWDIYNLIRAVTRPFPGAFTFWGGTKLFLWSARPPRDRMTSAPAGTVVGAGEEGTLEVATGHGILEVLRVQVQGAAEADGATFYAEALAGTRPRFSSEHPGAIPTGRSGA